jgi:hypothetical protein
MFGKVSVGCCSVLGVAVAVVEANPETDSAGDPVTGELVGFSGG